MKDVLDLFKFVDQSCVTEGINGGCFPPPDKQIKLASGKLILRWKKSTMEKEIARRKACLELKLCPVDGKYTKCVTPSWLENAEPETLFTASEIHRVFNYSVATGVTASARLGNFPKPSSTVSRGNKPSVKAWRADSLIAEIARRNLLIDIINKNHWSNHGD